MSSRFPDLDSLRALADPVRLRLYELVVEAGGPVSRDEAARAAGLQRPLAAYHLDKLVEAGVLEASYTRPEGRGGPGAGRPAKRYRTAEREFSMSAPPRDYRLLAELLADATAGDEGLRTRAGRLARAEGRRAGSGGEAVGVGDALRARGYEPFEAEDGILRLRNCPFHVAAQEHPELVCGLNLELVRGLLKGLGERPGRAILDPRPGLCCVALRPEFGTQRRG